MSIAYPLRSRVPHRRHARDVHARRLHPRRRRHHHSFLPSDDNVKAFGGGFDIRATASPASPIVDMRASLSARSRTSRFRVVSSVSDLPVDASQVGSPRHLRRPRGRPAFLANTTYRLAAGPGVRLGRRRLAGDTATRTSRSSIRTSCRAAPTRGFGPAQFQPDRLLPRGQGFTPIPVDVRDPQTGKVVRLTSSGSCPTQLRIHGRHLDLAVHACRGVRRPRGADALLLHAAPRGRPRCDAKELESAFLANGMQADSLQKLLDDVVAANMTFTG